MARRGHRRLTAPSVIVAGRLRHRRTFGVWSQGADLNSTVTGGHVFTSHVSIGFDNKASATGPRSLGLAALLVSFQCRRPDRPRDAANPSSDDPMSAVPLQP
jgi:hypothetical protein